MSNVMRLLGVLLLVGFSSQAAFADPYTAEYLACKERCARDNTECLTQLPATESPAKNAMETTCNMELKACNADCDEMKTVTGLVKRIME